MSPPISPPAEPLVLARHADGVAHLTLNAPAKANVLSMAMMDALDAALAAAADDPAVRVVVLGAAGRLFCAGHDLAELRADDDAARLKALFERCSALMMAIGALRAPVIAKVQGAAVAAGCQLVASCDLAWAAAEARFAVSGINLGLYCSTPGVAVGRAVGPRAAAEMLMTGAFIDAAQAQAIGLVNRAVPAVQLDAAVEAAAREIAAKPADAMALGKACFRAQMALPVAGAYAIAAQAMVENLGLASARDGIDAFLRR